jgi:acyl-coenzyme A thioesterase PaaI-like protein
MESVDTASTEVCVADVRIGEKLNGHDNIVHGGIISLMLDDTFGWG